MTQGLWRSGLEHDMAFNLTSLMQNRKQQIQQEQLAKQLGALSNFAFGQPQGNAPQMIARPAVQGALPDSSMNDALRLLLSSPQTAQYGVTGTLKALEEQRQLKLQSKKMDERRNALAQIPTDGRPGLKALVALAASGDEEANKALAAQLTPFTLSSDQQRFTGLGNSIAIGPEKAADLFAEQQKLFNMATNLRGDFIGITKPYEDQNQAYGRIVASAQDPSAAGDLALIFNYMKVLDPGSTVREGEFANAQNSGSVPQRIMANYNSVLNGERLTAEQRSDFVDRASRLFKQASEQHKKTAEQFRGIAKRNKLNPDDVVFNRQTIQSQVAPPPGFKVVP